uniref:Uncharacterized protein n=1 Tax=Triticum urartu TaxID=4572 RepID=A0A8R7QYE8_TRIUA
MVRAAGAAQEVPGALRHQHEIQGQGDLGVRLAGFLALLTSEVRLSPKLCLGFVLHPCRRRQSVGSFMSGRSSGVLICLCSFASVK